MRNAGSGDFAGLGKAWLKSQYHCIFSLEFLNFQLQALF
jgi:hypothetical protein